MRIYLVQHGEAASEEVDPRRSLTEKGVKDVEKVASFVKPLRLRVDSIWHSGKTRAVQTADILATSIILNRHLLQRSGLAPNDPVGPIVEELASFHEDLMIVGHLPFLSRLASALAAGDESREIVAFRQGGMVCLGKEAAGGSRWKIEWMVVPDLLP
jgi:phosphohistidine phosphatase